MRILVVKRDKVGDLLLATPMLRVLRAARPGARIEVLASRGSAWVLEGNPDVDRVWTYGRVRTGRRISWRDAARQALLALRLRLERYDVAIAANGEASPRALRRARLAGAARTIAYVDAPRAGARDELQAPTAGHETLRMVRLLAPLGIAADAALPMPRFTPAPAAQAEALAWLHARGLQPGRYAVIGIGARRAKKQPRAGQVLRWSEALHRGHGLATVFVWTPGRAGDPLYPGDDEAAADVVAAKAPWLHPFRGPLQPAAALAWHAAGSIFPDSGLMHLAAASPGGVLGLFAETDVSPHPGRWGPVGARCDYLDAPRSVAELDDGLVLGRFARLLSGNAAPG